MDSYNYKTELLKQEISFACNQSQLPPFILEGVLHQIMNEVTAVKMREMAVEAINKEDNDNGSDNSDSDSATDS